MESKEGGPPSLRGELAGHVESGGKKERVGVDSDATTTSSLDSTSTCGSDGASTVDSDGASGVATAGCASIVAGLRSSTWVNVETREVEQRLLHLLEGRLFW